MDNQERKTNRNVLMLVFGVVLTVALISGSTFAYWEWWSNESEQTAVTFTATEDFSCSADGGGNITSSDVILIPSSCTDSEYAIKREVTVMPSLYKDDLNISLDLWMNIKSIGNGLSNSENFKYALTTDDTSCESGVVSEGTFKGKTSGDTITMLDKEFNNTTTETYYLWIWLDEAETDISTTNQSFELSLGGECTNEVTVGNSDPEVPVLDDGMIPVTIANNGTVTTVSSMDDDWYDYENKEWANVVLVKEKGINERRYYKDNPGEMVEQNDILAYYVWIPRYKYKIWTTDTSTSPQTINIEFESANADITTGLSVGDYITHPAFIWDGETVPGIWVGKFETSHSTLASSTTSNNLGCTNENCTNADGLIIKPNVQSLRRNNVSNQFYASRSMTRSENPFGLSSSQTDSHMMKNSEWGAVAYLSHSKYGINREIYINNSSSRYTGRSGGNIGSDSTTTSTGGSYTWLGQPVTGTTTYGTVTDSTLGTNASTTGNVTGVYDMSGGAFEYVMGNYANTKGSSGFTTLPNSKYYDLYTSSNPLTACNGGVCFGHALFETSGWYNDYAIFVRPAYPWFFRGGVALDGARAGVWLSNGATGSAYDHGSFRSVAIIGT